MYKLLSRGVSKYHSGTLNFTNICRKVSEANNKSCSVLKRSVSNISLKSENAAEEAKSEQIIEEITDSRSTSIFETNYQIMKKSIFAGRSRDLIQTRKFRTSSVTSFFSSGINLSKKPSKREFPNTNFKKAMEQCLKIKKQKKRMDHPFINESLYPKPLKVGRMVHEVMKNTAKIESNANFPKKRQAVNSKQTIQDMTRYKKTIDIAHPKLKEPFKIVYPIRNIKDKIGFSVKPDSRAKNVKVDSLDKHETSISHKLQPKIYSKEKISIALSVPSKTDNKKDMVTEQEKQNQNVTNPKIILNRYAIKRQAQVKDESKLERISSGQLGIGNNLKYELEPDSEKRVLKKKDVIQGHPILFTEKLSQNLDGNDVQDNNTKNSDNVLSQKSNKYVLEDTGCKPTKDENYHQSSKKTITTKPKEMSEGLDTYQIASNIGELLKGNTKIDKFEDKVSRDTRHYIEKLNIKKQVQLDKFDNNKKNEEVINKVHVQNELGSNKPINALDTSKFSQSISNKSAIKQKCEDIKTNNDVLVEKRTTSTTGYSNMNKKNLLENFNKNVPKSAQVFDGKIEKLQKILFKYKCENKEQSVEVLYEKSEKTPTQNSDNSNERKSSIGDGADKTLPGLPNRPVSKHIRKIKETTMKTKKEPTSKIDSPISTRALLEKVRKASELKGSKLTSDDSSIKQNTTTTVFSKPDIHSNVNISVAKEELNPCVNQKPIEDVAPTLYQKVKLAEEIKSRMSNYRAESTLETANREFQKDSRTRNISEEETNKNIDKYISDTDGYKLTFQNNETVPPKNDLKENKVTSYDEKQDINNSQENEKGAQEEKTKRTIESGIPSIVNSKNEVANSELESLNKLQEMNEKKEQILEKTLDVSKANETVTRELENLLVDPMNEINLTRPDTSVVESKADSPKKRGKMQLRTKKYDNLRAKNLRRKRFGNITRDANENKNNSEEIEAKIKLEEKYEDKVEEEIRDSTEIMPGKEESRESKKEKIRYRTYNDLHLSKVASRKDKLAIKDSKQILMPNRSIGQSERQQKNTNIKENRRLRNNKELSEDSVTSNKSDIVRDKSIDKSVKNEEMNMGKPNIKKVDGSTDILKKESQTFSTSASKPEIKSKISSNVMGDYNKTKLLTADETICHTFKTLDDSYFVNLKKGNRAPRHDKIVGFQFKENITEHVQETNNDISATMDIVDHFQLLKEISNKAREGLKKQNKMNILQNNTEYKQKDVDSTISNQVNLMKDSNEMEIKSLIRNNDDVSCSTTGKDKSSDISVEQPFIRKELPRPSPKRDDKSKRDPPKTKTDIKLPPPKNQQGSKLDDEIYKAKQTPKTKSEINIEDKGKEQWFKNKLLPKNTKDVRKYILIKKSENMRDQLKCAEGSIVDLKNNFKVSPVPNLIKKARVSHIDNKKTRLEIVAQKANYPLKASSDVTSNFINSKSHVVLRKKQERILNKQNEFMVQETPHKYNNRRQPLPIHIVRKLMKIKRQRDKGKQYDRIAEYEKFFDVVTNPLETMIQKPDWKPNHSESSLMKIYLLEDDSKTEETPYSSKKVSEIEKEGGESEISEIKKPDLSASKQVMRSSETETPVEDVDKYSVENGEINVCSTTCPSNDKTVETKKNMSVTIKDNSSEKIVVDFSDMKQKKSLLLIFNAEKPDPKSKQKNISDDRLDSKQNRKDRDKIKLEEKDGNLFPGGTECGRESVVFVLKNHVTNEKNTINASHTMPMIDDREKCEVIDKETNKLMDENEKASEKPFFSNSTGKYDNTIHKLEECFKRIVENLRKLDEKGQLVKSVSNVNGMVSKCTNKFLEELLEKKAAYNQEQIELKKNQDKQNKDKYKKQVLEKATTGSEINENNESQAALPANQKLKIETCSANQILPKDEMVERNQLSSQLKQEVRRSKELILDNKEDKNQNIIQIEQNTFEKESDIESEENARKSATVNDNSDTDVMTAIENSLRADDLLKKPGDHIDKETNIMLQNNEIPLQLVEIIEETKPSVRDTDEIENFGKLRSSETNKNLDLYSFKDSTENSSTKNTLEVRENMMNQYKIALNNKKIRKDIGSLYSEQDNKTIQSIGDTLSHNDDIEVNLASFGNKEIMDDVIQQNKIQKIHNTTTQHIEEINSDVEMNEVKVVKVQNSSGKNRTLKSSSKKDKTKKGASILTENNIVKIIVQTQTANIVITNNGGFDTKASESKGSPDLEVAIKKLNKDAGEDMENNKMKSLESLFKDVDSMKKLVNKVEDIDISNKDSFRDKSFQSLQQNTITLTKLEEHDETKMCLSYNTNHNNLKIQSKEDDGALSDIHRNAKSFFHENISNLEKSKIMETCKKNSRSTFSKTAAKSLEQLNKEECTRYCFAEYDYSYAKRKAKKQLEKKRGKLDSDEICFRAYFSSIENRLNKIQDRSPYIQGRRDIERKFSLNDTNLNLNRNYSATSNAIISHNISTFNDVNTEKKLIHVLYREKLENKDTKKNFRSTLGNEDKIVPILSGKDDGDESSKSPDNKTPKEGDNNKKSDKASKKAVFRIVKAPNIHRSGRRYTKSVKLKAKKHKTKDSQKPVKPNYQGRRNVIIYLLQNQFNNRMNKSNLETKNKVSNPKEEIEKTINKFKVDITHDNDLDFHTVSIADAELYKEKRSRDNVYRSDIVNSKTKTVRTFVNDFDKKSTDPSSHEKEVNTKINLGGTKENKILQNKDVHSLEKSTDKSVSSSKYLLERQALLYKKHSAEYKNPQILNTPSVLKSTISQKSTSEHSVFSKRKASSKNEKSGNKSTNDKEIENNKSDDKETPKATLNEDELKTFRGILSDELENIFGKGPQKNMNSDKLVAKVEEFVDNKDMKLQKFNKKLRACTDLHSTFKSKIDSQSVKSRSLVSNNSTKLKSVETKESTHNSTSIQNLMHTKITIEKDIGNKRSTEVRETFVNAKKECEIVRIPPKSLFQLFHSLPNENDTTLTRKRIDKIISVRKSKFGKYPRVKITYVATNKGDSDTPLENFSTLTTNTNLSDETVTQSTLSVRYELLKKLQDEFNKQQSFNDILEMNKTKVSSNETEGHVQNYKDGASHTTEYSCLEKGSNQSLFDDKITSDAPSNMHSIDRAKNSLESFLKNLINKFGTVRQKDEKDPKK
ncbi:uncharacterized protein LOC130894053 [Diorhabda carinulata]|uniref:uncharacterized protein LOC130894053 n=1 Tax=Diorhabda carinulata TaxID=1163345 RepID=UPI0025A2216D|nr:uncharacterized protein LOC130894053 [Diorhabda carinulata]XP_057656577.1 uncharacterized protein LOC130894053 [Diorhabda carinulata]XP_057656578.1 uncharacterized protein LOC130894053 [Diorhabda carinulata]